MVQSEDIPMAMTSELCQEILRVQIDLSFSCWMENKGSPSYHDVLREVLSTSILSNSDRIYIKYLLDKPELIDIVDKVNPIPVVQKSVIEKSTNKPFTKICLMLLVKIQFGRLKPKLLNQNPLTRAQRLNLVLQRSGGNKTKAKMLVALQPV